MQNVLVIATFYVKLSETRNVRIILSNDVLHTPMNVWWQLKLAIADFYISEVMKYYMIANVRRCSFQTI